MRPSSYLFALLILVTCSLGCSRTKQLSFTFQGDSQMNNGGHFAIVRIYQLYNDTNFLNSEFEAFWLNDEAVLAEEIIVGTRQQISLYPNKPIEHTLVVDKEARFIGFAANLYEPDGDRWRQLYSVDQLEKEGVTIQVREYRLNVDLP